MIELQNSWKIKLCKKQFSTAPFNQVLESDEFEDISLELMKKIIRRDTLALSSELIVWHAVARSLHISQKKKCPKKVFKNVSQKNVPKRRKIIIGQGSFPSVCENVSWMKDGRHQLFLKVMTDPTDLLPSPSRKINEEKL